MMKQWLITTILRSKKFWYAVSSIVVPGIVTFLGVSPETAQEIFYAALTLVLGQGIADAAKR